MPDLIPAKTLRYSEVSLETAVGTEPAYLARPQIARKAKKLVKLFSFISHNRSVTILKSEIIVSLVKIYVFQRGT